jgi:hypothetical protein
MHDLKGMFPDDFYGPDGLRLYGSIYDAMGVEAVDLMRRMHGRPKAGVKVYRAIPYEPNRVEQIAFIERCKYEWLRREKVPEGAPEAPAGVRYFDHLCDELERLTALPEEPRQARPQIHPGDWVTPIRAYAKEHGEANLNNRFKIISQTVPASSLYTDGDVTEWGYWPEDAWRLAKAAEAGPQDAPGTMLGPGPRSGLRAAAVAQLKVGLSQGKGRGPQPMGKVLR